MTILEVLRFSGSLAAIALVVLLSWHLKRCLRNQLK